MNFTNDQKNAINCIDNNLQIIACAGSGKTGVVSARIANILKNKPEIKPNNITAFTFTEKAAEELKIRIYKNIREQIGEIPGIAEMYIGTIHGFCLKLLQDYISIFQKFSILDEVKTKIFIDKHFSLCGMKDLGFKRYAETNLYIQLIGIILESGINISSLPIEYVEAVKKYKECFYDRNYFDFTLIMYEAIYQIENNAELQTKLKERIKFLTVDEYQDVNPIQEKIVRLIHDMGANICVVGDDDQTIYQWRGSEIKNILTFEERYNLEKPVYLVDNFRSSNGVIDLAHRVIKNNTNRKPKKMEHKSVIKYEEGDITYKEFVNPCDENKYIAERINILLKCGYKYSDMVILLRIRRLAGGIIEQLQTNNIPFIVEGVNELFFTNEAQAFKGIFDYLNKKIDVEQLKELWLSISFSITLQDLDKAINYLDDYFPDKHKFYHTFVFQQIFQDFIDILQIKESEGRVDTNTEILLYNLGKISQVIDDFESIYYKTSPSSKLTSFCSFLEYTAKEYYPEGYQQNEYIKPDAVRIMTIHQAKGLEFPIVFIPALSKNIFPQPRGHGGPNINKHLDELNIPNTDRYRYTTEEDERRLYYVAVTRAKKYLFLSRAIYNQKMNRDISQFMIESKHSPMIFEDDGKTGFNSKQKIDGNSGNQNSIALNFSLLKDYYECAYRFKLSFFYGFVQPISPAVGYGRSLHNIVMDIHRNYVDGKKLNETDLNKIIDNLFYLPYSHEELYENMKKNADKSIKTYFEKNEEDFDTIEFVEKDIEIDFGNGIQVNGRIDLVKRREIDNIEKTYIIDFKSKNRAQIEEISEEQLKIYAIGYKELTGKDADFIEVYNLDNNEQNKKRITADALNDTKEIIVNAAENIRANNLEKICSKEKCANCYLKHICLTNEQKGIYGNNGSS